MRSKTIFSSVSAVLLYFMMICLAHATPDSPRVPLLFEANQGRTDSKVKFIARGAGQVLFLTPAEAVVKVSERASPTATSASTVVRVGYVDANANPRLEGSGLSKSQIRQLTDRGEAKIAAYSSVTYRNLYKGVDMLVMNEQGMPRFDFIVAPGADASAIRLSWDGGRDLRVDDSGSLVLRLANGELRFSKPIVYQEANGAREMIAAKYVVSDARIVSFEIADYDRNRTLVIDPTLAYSTYLGGTQRDQALAVAVDSAGRAYVAGHTDSVNFPLVGGAARPDTGGTDAFVAKFNADGTPAFITYLGGSGFDSATGIAVDVSGSVVVVGSTRSTDFPLNKPHQSTMLGSGDAFVTKLSPRGTILYSTYFGGNGFETAAGVAVDAEGRAFVTGTTSSPIMPASANVPLQGIYGGGSNDAFVAKYGTAGVLQYWTYLGGSGSDGATGIALDSEKNIYVTGGSVSNDFPTQAAFQPARVGLVDGFVTKIRWDGRALVYSTYIGGTDDWTQSGMPSVFLKGIAVDSAGNAWVGGRTPVVDFPIVNALQPLYSSGMSEGVVARFSPAGTLTYSSYFGGPGEDSVNAVAVDQQGNVYLAGYTEAYPTGLALANPIQSAHGDGVRDAFVAKINAAATAYLFSSYLGGQGEDHVNGIGVDAQGNIWVAGDTSYIDFPLQLPFQPVLAGGNDAFVTRICNNPGCAP
jgi:hypothetical protein